MASQFAQQITDTLLDLIFPPRCLGCKKPGSLICQNCGEKIPPVPPISNPNSPLAERRATAEFDGLIQTAIHRFKYENQRRYGVPLGERLAAELRRSGWNPTLITATPLHPNRLQSRGYNQAALLAQQLAGRVNIPFSPDVIRRLRDTRAQVGLNYKDRQSNMAGAFEADPGLAAGQRIVIVDDVYTTGATLSECAQTLHAAGAEKVWALTVAAAIKS